MSERWVINRILFFSLMLLVVISPLPLGSNREWSWSLCALIAGALALIWAASNIKRTAQPNLRLNPLIPLLFVLACGWAIVQLGNWSPAPWQHPLWLMAGEALSAELPGRISLSADDTWTALMRLLSYALVFALAYQLTRDRARAQAAFGWMAIAGLVYAVFALYVYWGGYHPEWLFEGRVLPHDVRGTFINRNHFATWQGLTMLCAMANFYHRMARPVVKPYAVPQDRETLVVEFILRAWMPLTALLLMVTALVLTHSRGGFTAALAATITLLYLLDRRVAKRGASSRKSLSRATVITALAVTSIAFYLTSEAVLDRINSTDISSEERMAVFADVNRGITDNPVLGFGYGTFADSFRLYDRNESAVHYDRAHNTWMENAFELGLPAALALFLSIIGLALVCLRGVGRRHRDWIYPATGVAASVLVGLHATVDFSLQLPAVANLFACIMGVAVAQSFSTSSDNFV
ncbi:O-antigen ligase family protein [Pseudomonadota bacterium]